jgi:hypothetical protein
VWVLNFRGNMEIMTAKEAKQKSDESNLKSIMNVIEESVKTKVDCFISVKNKYITKYVSEKLILAGYKITKDTPNFSFISWVED